VKWLAIERHAFPSDQFRIVGQCVNAIAIYQLDGGGLPTITKLLRSYDKSTIDQIYAFSIMPSYRVVKTKGRSNIIFLNELEKQVDLYPIVQHTYIHTYVCQTCKCEACDLSYFESHFGTQNTSH
jgi:hypothetical protein